MFWITKLKYNEPFFSFEWEFEPDNLENFIVEEIADYEGISYEEAAELYEASEVHAKTMSFVYEVALEYFHEEAYNEYKEYEAYKQDQLNLASESYRW